jgi:4-hydroxy-tetrahydrodipicolinate reductase
MGQTLAQYLKDIPDITLAACLEAGEPAGPFLASACTVVLDLSLGRAVEAHGPGIVAAGKAYIVGATGYSAAAVAGLERASAASGAPVLLVPNFSLSANLMIKFASAAAKLMHSPVITERHHERKADAPSGTARYTAARISEALAGAEPGLPSTGAQYQEQLPGVLGGADGGVAIHSLRGEGYLAEQAVQLCLPGESLTIEHRSIDRRCFMPGIVYAIRNIHRVRGVQTGLDSIM